MSDAIFFEANELMEEWMDIAFPPEAPIDYLFGLWLECHFNRVKKMQIPYQELHQLSRAFCQKNLLL